MIIKYLVLSICLVKILNYCSTDDSKSPVTSLTFLKRPANILPVCLFGIDEISFILYTRNMKNGVVLTVTNITNIDVFKKDVLTRPIIFLIHGFLSFANNTKYNELSDALLEKEDALVISIDWKDGACDGGISIAELFGYYKAVDNTRQVGEYIANLTQLFVEEYNVKMDNITVIGHSLGAHVAGFAGKRVQKLQLGNYSQIVGLDPANPFFGNNDCDMRLCKSDANFVMIIHTSEILGLDKDIGNIDFYMNKGRLQPGCNVNPSCSHLKAVKYLTSSVKYERCFIATPWDKDLPVQPISKCTKDSCVYVGLNLQHTSIRGSYYVAVKPKSPFCNNNGTALR